MIFVHLLFIFFSALMFGASCKTNKQVTNAPRAISAPQTRDSLSIYLQKNPGFGNFQVFEISINQKGKARFVGKQNVSKIGTYEKKITQSDLDSLKNAFTKDFFALPENSNIKTLSLSMITIRYFELKKGNKIDKKVNVKGRAPRPFHEIEKRLQRLADSSEGWVKISR